MERQRFMSVIEALTNVERLDAPAAGVDGSTGEPALTLADIIADPSAEISDATERVDLARWLMTQIPQRQALALRAFYGVQMTKQEDPQTCADLSVTASTLRGLRRSGVENCRKVAALHGLAA
jgi:RNA polymerase primary sigma factor